MSLKPIDVFPLWDTLGEEITSLRPVSINSSEIKKRIFTRSVFSFVEGVLYVLRQICLSKPECLTHEEHLLLKETTASIDDRGIARSIPIFSPTDKSTRFVFRVFQTVFDIGWSPDYSGEGWKSFQTGLKVRNRIVHPKSVESLNITSEEFTAVTHAHLWFSVNSMTLLMANTLNDFKSSYVKVPPKPAHHIPDEVQEEFSKAINTAESHNARINKRIEDQTNVLRYFQELAEVTSKKYDQSFDQRFEDVMQKHSHLHDIEWED